MKIKEPYKTYIGMYKILDKILKKDLHPSYFCNNIGCRGCPLTNKVKKEYGNVEGCDITEEIKTIIEEKQKNIEDKLTKKYRGKSMKQILEKYDKDFVVLLSR